MKDIKDKKNASIARKAIRVMKKANDRDEIASVRDEAWQRQNEHRKVYWHQVRQIYDPNRLVIEKALSTFLASELSKPLLVYDTAKWFVERYEPEYGSGIVRKSLPRLEQLLGFWKRRR